MARNSVVLPAPFAPASATRSRRLTVKETPSKSGVPECSLRRLLAISTATRRSVEVDQPRSGNVADLAEAVRLTGALAHMVSLP